MISRRDFFKLLGIGALGALIPTKGLEALERNTEMNVGDLLVKLADGIPLSPEEKQRLRLHGNQTQLSNAFVDGLQSGNSDVNARSLSSVNSDIENIYETGVMPSDISSFPVLKIPQKYNHIIFYSNGRSYESSPPGASWVVGFQCNGDTGSNYLVNGVSATYLGFGGMYGDDAAANLATSFFAIIPNFRSSFYKTSLSYFGYGGTETFWASSWLNVEPIREVRLIGNFKAGSSVTISCLR